MQQGNKSQNTAHKYVKLLIKHPQLFSQQVAMGLLNSSTGELLGIPWVHFFFSSKKTPSEYEESWWNLYFHRSQPTSCILYLTGCIIQMDETQYSWNESVKCYAFLEHWTGTFMVKTVLDNSFLAAIWFLVIDLKGI